MSEKYIYKDNLCLIKTNKYKSINVYFNFAKEYDLKTKLALNILGSFIGNHSLTYKTKRDMIRQKDMLYGVDIASSLKAKSNLIILSVKYSFINPKFLKDVFMNDYINFIEETLEQVFFSEELFSEYRKTYKDLVARSLDNPANFAKNRVSQILSQNDERFNIYDIDHINEIDDITLDDVKEIYNDLFKGFSLDIFVIGDYDDNLLNYLKNYKSQNNKLLLSKTLNVVDNGEVVEEKDVSQSCLNVVYKTNVTRASKDFYINTLGNILFGVIPTSLLFEEIREKRSLCYHVVSLDYKNEGIIRIYLLYDKKNTDIIIKEIDKQINRIINLDYELDKIDSAKALMIDSLRSTFDDNDSTVDYLYTNKLNGIDISIEEYETNIQKVTAKDIARVFSNYTHVLTHVLQGVKNEEDI